MVNKRGTCPTLKDWCRETGSSLLNEWVCSNDPKISPETVTIGSTKPCVLWMCKLGHQWNASVNDRICGKGCPYCASKRVLKGFNDLASQCPDLAKEWDFELNEKKPDEVIKGSNKRAFWKCSKGHRWDAVISSRSLNGNGCPYCAGQRTIKGVNDLQTLYPDIASQWHPTKNGDLEPSDVMPMSNKPVYWLCRNGHESKAPPYSRVTGKGCPICTSESRVSFNEKAIAYYLSQKINIEESAHLEQLGKMELDVFLPDYSIAVEYDGSVFHKSISRDLRKNKMCSEAGIKLYRVREPGCAELSDCIQIKLASYDTPDVEKSIRLLLNLIGSDINLELDADIDLERDRNTILEKRNMWETENSLEVTNPEIAKEWHPTKNGNLRPYMFKTYANRKFWWQCEEGHEWKASIKDRVRDHTNCPYCGNKKVLQGYNDLLTKFPHVVKEWDYSKNKQGPECYLPYSNKKVWWICEKGHSHLNSIDNKTKGERCPYCIGKRVLKGFNDVATTHPHIAELWDYEKNKKGPDEYVRFANVKINFKCSKGHCWSALLNGITDDVSCPYCSGRMAIPGETDLTKVIPEAKNYWNYEKNDLGPEQYLPHSNKKVWWICNLNHEWEARISDFYKGHRCPYCGGKKILPGFNDLATKRPDLAKEWHPTKNGSLKPTDLSPRSGRSVWWQCEKGHEWHTSPSNRTAGTGCPECYRLKRQHVSD